MRKIRSFIDETLYENQVTLHIYLIAYDKANIAELLFIL